MITDPDGDWYHRYSQNNRVGFYHLQENEMAHIGFKKLEKKIAANPKVTNAGAVVAAIGRKKYGEKKMKEAAAKGKPLKESQAKKK